MYIKDADEPPALGGEFYDGAYSLPLAARA